ncbi:Exostosin family protein [Euphorbia peplus]|nr:Exostosin family protein [Euphorbia peplus]
MTEKTRLPSRFLFFLIPISVFLLIISSISLVQFENGGTFLSKSVLKLMLLNNNTSIYLKSNVKPNFFSSMPPRIEDKSSTSGRRKHVKRPCDLSRALLRVYMYDLPPEFHFGLLGWKGKVNQIWPSVDNMNRIPVYPGGLNLQHSIEYWLTLDLLASNRGKVGRPCSALRVYNSSEADIIFVPFFASLSYNRHSKLRGKEKVSVNKMLQNRLVQFLMGQNEWKRSGGKDHLIVAHHPNSMLEARKMLGSAMFVLADFGRYPIEIANLQKDIIAPYKHVVRTIPSDNSAHFDERPILLFFRGAIYRKDGGIVRQELYYLLKDEKDVHFMFGTVQGNGINRAGEGMASSKFCLNIAGDTPSSNRLFDSIASHCIPVIISDDIELPFEDVLDYSQFSIFVRASDAIKKGYLLNLLRGIGQTRWTIMWEKLKEITTHFEYQYPSQAGDAVDMIWQAVSRKTSSVHFTLHRKNRYKRSMAQ